MRELRKILVTGAAGFVGTALQQELRTAFYPVLALLRPTSDPQGSVRLGSHVYRGDVLDKESMRDAFAAGTEAVVHLVGVIEEDEATFERIHIEGTRNVVELAREYNLKKIVHMSALGTRSGARSRYHLTKWRAEEIVQGSSVPWTIVRPSVIFGPDSGFMRTVELVARVIGMTPIVGDGRTRLQPIYVRDVARMIRRCLEDERTDGKVYDVGGPDVLTLDEVFRLVETRLGRPGKMHVPVPGVLASLAAATFDSRVLGALARWVDRNVIPIPRISRDQLVMLGEDSVADMTPSKSVFDFELRRLRDWLSSSEYVERPWKTWRGRWLVSPDRYTPAEPPKNP